MDITKIALDERFTDFELAQMFNVDCNPTAGRKHAAKVRNIEEPYALNDIKIPLWKNRKRTLKRGERNALQQDDYCRREVSTNPPGSKDRIEDLRKYYSSVEWDTPDGEVESAFDC